MSGFSETPRYQGSAAQGLVLNLTNAKYTYTQFRTFYLTVLDLLNYTDLLQLTRKKRSSAIYFIIIMVSLVNEPGHPAIPAVHSGLHEPMEN